MAAPRGFVLVNALILVTALSAVALWLLSRAETGRVRAAAALQATQLELYLDAYENLAREVLNRDAPSVDHLAEAWARDDHELELDRGRVAGRITDLEGRFNVNWLANPEDEAVREAFVSLTTRLGVPILTAETIMKTVAPGADTPSRPKGGVEENIPGGPVLLLDQLPVSARDRQLLQPYLAALPGDSRLNVNTVSAPVLAGFLQGANPAALDALLIQREIEPFTSVDAFIDAVVDRFGGEVASEVDKDRLKVNSTWFAATSIAELDGQQARRRAVIQRFPLPTGALVAYREDDW